LSKSERNLQITEEVCDFLESLFSDRVFLWRSASGRSGGWRNAADGIESEWVRVPRGVLPVVRALPDIRGRLTRE